MCKKTLILEESQNVETIKNNQINILNSNKIEIGRIVSKASDSKLSLCGTIKK